ncbi:MAG: hypothetical protein ACI4B8_03520 [Candidatus Gastranaerophilaceae bacterium]
MDFSTFLKNTITRQGLNKYAFGSLSQSATDRLNNLSMFSSASAQDISGIDLKALLAAAEAADVDAEGATGQQKALNDILKTFLEIEDVQKAADSDGDGKLSEAEAKEFLASIMGNDGDASTITMSDIDIAIEKMGIDLNEIANKAAEDVLEDKKAEEADSASPSSSGGSISGGGVSGSSSPSSGISKQDTQKTTAETVEELEAQLADEESLKASVQELIQEKIQEQDDIISEAMNEENSGFTPEAKEEYDGEKAKIDGEIKTKDTEIEGQKSIIQENEASMSSTKEAIGSLEEQKSSLESQLGSISDDDEKAADKRADINSKISNIQGEIDTKQGEYDRAEEAKKAAEDEKERLEGEKKTLETNRDGLMDEIIKKHKLDVNPEVKKTIQDAQSEIQKIRSDGQEAITECDNNIQDFKTKIAQAKEAEKTQATIKENEFKQGLGLTGEELVDVARQMLDRYGSSKGYCATGVSRTFQMAYGLSLSGNGCDWDSNMDKLVEQGAFVEVTSDYKTSDELSNLPAGAVVCWEASGNGSTGGAKYGHVTIADGKGGEISDHYAANIYKSIGGRSDLYRVYLPVT